MWVLAMGAALGTVAVIVRQEIILFIRRFVRGRGFVGDVAAGSYKTRKTHFLDGTDTPPL